MTDIVDEIDALVDEQLSGYSERSGYDYNVNQDRCGHCHREWHGLKITERIESMAAQVTYDEDYRYADDDSDVLCPGSSFIGPWATRRQIERMRSSELSEGAQSSPYTLDDLMHMRATEFVRNTRQNPYVRWRESGDRGIESTTRTTTRFRNNPFARRPYQEPRQLVRGDVVVMTVGGERRHVSVVVDIIEGDDGTTSFVTEDPRYSTRAQQLRDELAREQASAREAAIRGVEASQVVIDEGRPYRYGEDFSFTHQATPPELQHPREWPDYMGALQRILEWPNPFLVDEVRRARFTPFSELWTLPDDPFDETAWTVGVGNPEPDTRTPQERALPRPSTTPPMWAVDAGRQRRTRTNSRRRHR